MDRFRATIQAIDDANAQDPRQEESGGRAWPHELLYSHRMTAWLERLEPQASELLKLAVRAQHIRRWEVPRAGYPMDRAGYLRWRTDLAAFHARVTGDIMRQAGYGPAEIECVQALLRKERIKQDPEAQALEDVACLVFLEHELADFGRDKDWEKIARILRRTWKKMSPRGQVAALGLELPPQVRELLAGM
jgi:hypothetical protein